MTLADDQERDRLAARERELEAARPWPSKLRDALDALAEGHDVALRLIVICVAIVLGWTLCRCDAPILHPPTGPNTDYPCGLQGVSCGGGMCCWLGDVCGTGAPTDTCPAGYCCNENVDVLASRKPTYWQFKAQ